MAVTIIRPSTHEAWLELRKGGIGSSEVGSILGVNPYETPYQCWLRKTGRTPPKEENAAMLLGHLLEDAVARLYAKSTGNTVDETTAGDWCARSDFREYTTASPDRICVTPDGGRVLLECKTTQLDVSEDDYPKSWFCQVQYLLACAEMDEGAIAWLKRGRDFGTKRIVRNKEFQEFMFARLDRFWNDCIKGGKAPDPVSVEDVVMMHPTSEAKSVAATPGIASAVAELRDKRGLLASLTDDCKRLEDGIKMFMGDADALTVGLDTVCTWKTAKGRVTVDTKALKEDHPDLYKEYERTGSPTRVFRLK